MSSVNTKNENQENNKRSLRCMNDYFFNLMSKLTENDCSSSIKEQIGTEDLVKASYEDFMTRYLDDSE
jgi:hypothetical protein